MIKFRLIKFENCLLFQISEMSEILRNKYNDSTYHYTHGDMNIASCDSPELSSDTIYIRGRSKNYDYNISIKKFGSNIDRDLYYDKIIDTFKRWSKLKLGK